MLTAIIIVGVLAVGFGGLFIFGDAGRREIKNLPIAAVDFNKLSDGSYVGEYKGTKDSFRNAKVQVTVSSGKVSDIKLLQGALDKEGKPLKLSGDMTVDDLFGRVIEAQTLQVDTISGATITSKAHLKAVENALELAQ